MNILRELWPLIERHSRAVVVVPPLVAVATTFLTGRTFFFQVGVVWFLSAISVLTGVGAISEARRKRRYSRRAALSAGLQFGGYSFAAASMAAMAAFGFWSPMHEVPRVLVYLMFAGLAAMFSSAFLHKTRACRRRDQT